jgi:hypothetical protein
LDLEMFKQIFGNSLGSHLFTKFYQFKFDIGRFWAHLDTENEKRFANYLAERMKARGLQMV